MLHPHVLRDMALFVEVAKRGSFSRAAAALDMPVSSLSRRIMLFESAVGLRLIERTTRRLVLTRHGKTYLPRATRLVEEAQRTVDDMLSEAKGPRVPIRIAAPPEPWILRQLSRAVAEAKLSERIHLHVDLAESVTEPGAEGCDLTVMDGGPADAVGALASLETGLYASRSYLERRGAPTHPSDLGHQEIILVGQGRSAEWRLRCREETATVRIAARLSCTSPALARQLAIDGLGIIAAASVEIREELREGLLIPVLPTWRLPERPIQAVAAKRSLPTEARSFLDRVLHRIEAAAAEEHRG